MTHFILGEGDDWVDENISVRIFNAGAIHKPWICVYSLIGSNNEVVPAEALVNDIVFSATAIESTPRKASAAAGKTFWGLYWRHMEINHLMHEEDDEWEEK